MRLLALLSPVLGAKQSWKGQIIFFLNDLEQVLECEREGEAVCKK